MVNKEELKKYKRDWAKKKRASLPKKKRKQGYRLSQAHKDAIRNGMLGKPKSFLARQRLSNSRKGIKFSELHRKKLSEAQKRIGTIPPSRRHIIPWNYKGISTLVDQIRKSFEYRQWRSDVFTRDGFLCRKCNIGGKLHAHHIKSFAKILIENNIITLEQALNCSELWNINNGITKCIPCHKIDHKLFAKVCANN